MRHRSVNSLVAIAFTLATVGFAEATSFFFGGGLTGVPGIVGNSIINQTNGTTTNCANGTGNPAGCSTTNPATPGIDPTNATYGAKGDVRGAGEWFGTAPQTTTGASITSSGTTLTVNSATGFPTTGNYTIFVDSMSSTTTTEEMTVTGGQGTTSWTVTRGVNGTTGVAHNSGVTILGMGDGQWNYNDSSCGTAHNCFESASGNFTSGDVGKIISINGISSFNVIGEGGSGSAFLGTPPFVMTNHSTYVTVSSVQSSTQLTLSATPTISTANSLYSGLAWVMGTNDFTAFQNAVNAGDLHIPNHYYLFAPTNTAGPNGGFPTDSASGGVYVSAHRDIWCDKGATLINVAFDQFTEDGTATFITNGNDEHFRNCTFDQTNVGQPGAPGLGTNANTDFNPDIYISTYNAPGNDNILILDNNFNFTWSQSAIQNGVNATTSFSYNIQIIGNTFNKCHLYGPVFTGGSEASSIAFNTLTDCAMGSEPNDSGSTHYVNSYNYYAGNILTCVYSGGSFTYITGNDQLDSNALLNDVFDNTVSGTAFKNSPCYFNASQAISGDWPSYVNNQVQNGANFR